MFGLKAVKESDVVSNESYVTEEITLDTLSPIYTGKYGKFRQIGVQGSRFNVDAKRVINGSLFHKGCSATITVRKYTKEEEEKSVIESLVLSAKNGSGIYVVS